MTGVEGQQLAPFDPISQVIGWWASHLHRAPAECTDTGRTPGFLLAARHDPSGVVDVVLIPEVPFKLQGPTGLLAYLETVLEKKGHAVVCVAEGAGQVGCAGVGGVQ